MIAAIAALQAEIAPQLAHVFAVFLRVGGLLLLLPGLGDRLIPVRIRLAGAFALSVAVAPLVASGGPVAPGLIAVETATGAALGAVVRFVIQALLMAGMIAAQLTSLSQLFGAVEPSSAMGNMLNLAGLALLMALGLPMMVVEMLTRSYDVFPMGGLLGGDDLAQWGVARMAQGFALAFALAAPFALAALLYNAALGVLNRAMPQLMVALVGAPAITWISAVLLFLAAPLILTVWQQAILGLLADPLTGGSP
ncbi:MAG: flagellar biosynthetic protein FliR [Pseudomonadota bacterium]